MSNEIKMVEICLPFPGYYESWLSAGIDDAAEMTIEDMIENDEISDAYDPNENYINYNSEMYDMIGRRYVEELNGKIEFYCAEINISPFVFHYATTDSPREYNFTMDRLVCTVSESDAVRMYRATDKAILRKVLQDRHTSYDGFISFYSNDLDQWIADKPVKEWDCNQLESVFMAFVRMATGEETMIEFECEICEELNDDYWRAADMIIDFDKIQKTATA